MRIKSRPVDARPAVEVKVEGRQFTVLAPDLTCTRPPPTYPSHLSFGNIFAVSRSV
jgi:hypothetical protein